MQRLGGQIATGEFGAVVRGQYNGSLVAIKTIKKNADKKNMAEFFRQVRLELQSLSAVGSHPNIVQLLGATGYFPGPGDGPNALRMEIVLELVPNGTLWQALHRGKLFTTWGEKIQLLQGIADGVQYLHSKSIVHRDLSSANILLSAQWTPKIADFGCARITSGGRYLPKNVLGFAYHGTFFVGGVQPGGGSHSSRGGGGKIDETRCRRRVRRSFIRRENSGPARVTQLPRSATFFFLVGLSRETFSPPRRREEARDATPCGRAATHRDARNHPHGGNALIDTLN